MDINGYEGMYEISNMGRLRSYYKGKWPQVEPTILDCGLNYKGYRRARLVKNGRSRSLRISRMVLEVFSGPCPKGMQCAHLDGNRTNDVITNLKWVTPKENQSHRFSHGTAIYGERCHLSKLKDKEVIEIKKRLLLGERGCDLAVEFGMSRPAMSSIKNGRSWAHVEANV